MRKSTITTAITAYLLFSGAAYAITAPELFNDGKKAFNNGRWQECEESMIRLSNTFPEHLLASEARYYQTLASTRNFQTVQKQNLNNAALKWKQELDALKKDFPKKDFSELEIAISIAEKQSPVTWEQLKDLSPIQLKHCLNRNWHPEPEESPIEAIKWSHEWLKKHTPNSIEPWLLSKISLVQSKAMWKILLSPLSMNANSDILKVCECWPVHIRLEQTLKTGFESGDPETKREIALLGYHYDYFRLRGVVRSDLPTLKSRWLTYLTERGLNHQEAWIPR